MRAVIQRVSRASVTIGGKLKSGIGPGLLVFVGIEEADDNTDAGWLCNKIVNLRIFDDDEGVMNHSLLETKGQLLVISQFTLHSKTKKGNRPSYIRAAGPEIAKPLYNKFVDQLAVLLNKEIGSGEFGAMMMVESVNDGPVTILIDTKDRE